MESQAKGTHYNICACERKGTTEGGKKTRRYGRALHDTRVLTCSTSGSRYARHPGVGHKIKANGRNDTGRKQYRNMQRKEIQKEKRQRKRYKKTTAQQKRTDTGNRRKAAGSPENTKQATTQQTC